MSGSSAPLIKPLVALLYGDEALVPLACEAVARALGPLEPASEPFDFEHTRYYEAEMGRGLRRRFVALAALQAPAWLVEAKLRLQEVERALAGPGGRRVNLDPGYLDLGKLVLASAKPAGHKLYLGQGVYADLLLHYHDRRLEPLPWAFPDFKGGRYDGYLMELRRRFLVQRRTRVGDQAPQR